MRLQNHNLPSVYRALCTLVADDQGHSR
jgi:hypothetical protein